MANDGRLSAAKYAQRIGVSKQAVSAAIKAGRLQHSVEKTKNGYKIDPILADQEWNAGTDPDHYNPNKKEGVTLPAATLPKPPTHSAPQKGAGSDLAMAKKATAVYKAKMAELDYKTKAGELVSKREVYSELFAFGQRLRQELQQLPDLIVDEIRAAGSRAEAHRLLTDHIADALEMLTKKEEEQS